MSPTGMFSRSDLVLGETDSDARLLSFLFADFRLEFPRSRLAGGPIRPAAQTGLKPYRHGGHSQGEDHICPFDKQTIGHRVALIARAEVYGEAIESDSPEFLHAAAEPNPMRVWFIRAEGLTGDGQGIGGSELAGDDHNLMPAMAKIEKMGEYDTVLVSPSRIAFALCAL